MGGQVQRLAQQQVELGGGHGRQQIGDASVWSGWRRSRTWRGCATATRRGHSAREGDTGLETTDGIDVTGVKPPVGAAQLVQHARGAVTCGRRARRRGDPAPRAATGAASVSRRQPHTEQQAASQHRMRIVAGPCGLGLSHARSVSTNCGLVWARPRIAACTVMSGVGSVGSTTRGARTGCAVGLKMSSTNGLPPSESRFAIIASMTPLPGLASMPVNTTGSKVRSADAAHLKLRPTASVLMARVNAASKSRASLAVNG